MPKDYSDEILDLGCDIHRYLIGEYADGVETISVETIIAEFDDVSDKSLIRAAVTDIKITASMIR